MDLHNFPPYCLYHKPSLMNKMDVYHWCFYKHWQENAHYFSYIVIYKWQIRTLLYQMIYILEFDIVIKKTCVSFILAWNSISFSLCLVHISLYTMIHIYTMIYLTQHAFIWLWWQRYNRLACVALMCMLKTCLIILVIFKIQLNKYYWTDFNFVNCVIFAFLSKFVQSDHFNSDYDLQKN